MLHVQGHVACSTFRIMWRLREIKRLDDEGPTTQRNWDFCSSLQWKFQSRGLCVIQSHPKITWKERGLLNSFHSLCAAFEMIQCPGGRKSQRKHAAWTKIGAKYWAVTPRNGPYYWKSKCVDSMELPVKQSFLEILESPHYRGPNCQSVATAWPVISCSVK